MLIPISLQTHHVKLGLKYQRDQRFRKLEFEASNHGSFVRIFNAKFCEVKLKSPISNFIQKSSKIDDTIYTPEPKGRIICIESAIIPFCHCENIGTTWFTDARSNLIGI